MNHAYLQPLPYPPETRHLTAIDHSGKPFPVAVIGERVWDGIAGPLLWHSRPGKHISEMVFRNFHLEDQRAA